MKIAVIGTGYVGLVAGVCFAEAGNDVIGVDVNLDKLARLNAGELPIYEPGLEHIFARNTREERLLFTDDLAHAVAESEIIFLALPTPPGANGSADLKYVLGAARDIGKLLSSDSPYKIIVTKSTVPVGTADKVRAALAENAQSEFDVISNPEFLREGVAIEDFMKPERVVIGIGEGSPDPIRAETVMRELYRPFLMSGNPLLVMDARSAEVTKYAANSMLALRISFMNDIANLCEKCEADVDRVRLGIGLDSRIGKRFLFAGTGYGGSCFGGDETIWLRENGALVARSLEENWENRAGVVRDKGCDWKPGNAELLAFDCETGKPVYTAVEAWTKRFYRGQMVTITTSMNRQLRVTADHPVIVREDGLLAMRLAATIQAGDEILALSELWQPQASSALTPSGAQASGSAKRPPGRESSCVREDTCPKGPDVGDEACGLEVRQVSFESVEISVYSAETATGTLIVGSGLVAHNCFPKDVQALVATGQEFGAPQTILEAAEAVNQRQKKTLIPRIEAHFDGDLSGKTFAVWGLAFKPNTDDIREAPALVIVDELIGRGAKVKAYDPEAMVAVEAQIGDKYGESFGFVKRHYDACDGADAIVIVTEWPKFREPDFEYLKELLNEPTVFDGRNVYELETMRREGFNYYSIGRPIVKGLAQ